MILAHLQVSTMPLQKPNDPQQPLADNRGQYQPSVMPNFRFGPQ